PRSAPSDTSSAEATPETRFAPARLCASFTRSPTISATMAAVVVFPFVAETSAEPSGRRRASFPTAAGSTVARIFPGMVVPPPLPASLDSLPAALASAISARSRTRASVRARSPPSNGGTSRRSPEVGKNEPPAGPIIRADFQCGPRSCAEEGRRPYAAGQRHEGQLARQRSLGKAQGRVSFQRAL